MKRKFVTGDLTESMFAFTFEEGGTYVFNDAANKKRIMVVTVKNAGEGCADPDRYVQTISGDSLSEVGVQQNRDILLRPNMLLYWMLILSATVTVTICLYIVTYCMRKSWDIKELETPSYKDAQLPTDFHHKRDEVFEKDNVFE